MKNSPLKFEIQILILIFIHALYQMVNQWPMPVLYGHKWVFFPEVKVFLFLLFHKLYKKYKK